MKDERPDPSSFILQAFVSPLPERQRRAGDGDQRAEHHQQSAAAMRPGAGAGQGSPRRCRPGRAGRSSRRGDCRACRSTPSGCRRGWDRTARLACRPAPARPAAPGCWSGSRWPSVSLSGSALRSRSGSRSRSVCRGRWSASRSRSRSGSVYSSGRRCPSRRSCCHRPRCRSRWAQKARVAWSVQGCARGLLTRGRRQASRWAQRGDSATGAELRRTCRPVEGVREPKLHWQVAVHAHARRRWAACSSARGSRTGRCSGNRRSASWRYRRSTRAHPDRASTPRWTPVQQLGLRLRLATTSPPLRRSNSPPRRRFNAKKRRSSPRRNRDPGRFATVSRRNGSRGTARGRPAAS